MSNFYLVGVTGYDDDGLYPSVEHAFQATKTRLLAARNTIRVAASPSAARAIGRTVPLRKDWERIKVKVMRDLIRKKFFYPELRILLTQTGDTFLVEGNTWNDRFWGVCDGRGRNMLGHILMQVREEIRK